MRTTKEGYHVAILFIQQFAEEMKMPKEFDAKCPDEGRVCIHGEVID